HVSPNYNLFQLGGHSLSAIRIISRVRDSFNVELPVDSVLKEPTLCGFARLIEDAVPGIDGKKLLPLLPREKGITPPLSFAQERLWFVDQANPGTSVFNIAMPLRLIGTLNASALEKTLNEI